MQQRTPAKVPFAARPVRPGTVGLVAAALLWWGPHAHAAGPSQTALCDGYTVGTCAVTVGTNVAAHDQLFRVYASGNPGTHLVLQFYAIEFNSAGEITGLVPSGEAVDGVTRALSGGRGQLDEVRLVPRTLPDVPGGWGFVGLADDSSLDLTTRLGQVVELGGRTLKLLGDGYAEQKPVGVSLELHVLGNISGVGYWVEYQAPDGTWTPVPGHGYTSPQYLRSSPGEVSVLTYTVPASLTPGQAHRFRINHHLNYGGDQARPIAQAAFAEWTVVPSDHGEAAPRGKQFDPSKAPGTPDPEHPGPGPDGGAPQTPGENSEDPSGTPTSSPSAPRTPAPQSPRAPQAPASSSVPSAEATTSTAPSPAPSPATASADPGPVGGPATPVPPSPGTGPVWGEEARLASPPAAGGTPRPVAWTWLIGLLGVVAAPAAWAWWRRRAGTTGGESW